MTTFSNAFVAASFCHHWPEATNFCTLQNNVFIVDSADKVPRPTGKRFDFWQTIRERTTWESYKLCQKFLLAACRS